MALILDGTNGLSDVDGTAGTPAIRGSDANTGVFFGTDIVGVSTGGSERMRVDASGNVGIGTSSPVARLQAVSAPGSVQIRWSDATNGTANLDTASGLSRIWTNVGMAFGTGSESFAERARIDSSGNLLVGGTAFTAGNTVARVSGGNLSIRSNVSTSFEVCNFLNSNGQVGTISTSGSSTSYNTSSDYRLKENIAPMTGALARVQQLKPVTYTWKSTGEDGEGFIAHELQEVCPSAVTGEKDAVDAEGNPKYQGIDTSFLVATLTAAIQEQQAIIQSLTARIEALENQT